MRIKDNLRTDAELNLGGVQISTLTVGTDENGFVIKRRFRPDLLEVRVNDKVVVVHYEEWREVNGKIYEELYQVKNYMVTNIVSKNDNRFDLWVGAIAQMLVPAIAESLTSIPAEAPTGWVLNGENV